MTHNTELNLRFRSILAASKNPAYLTQQDFLKQQEAKRERDRGTASVTTTSSAPLGGTCLVGDSITVRLSSGEEIFAPNNFPAALRYG